MCRSTDFSNQIPIQVYNFNKLCIVIISQITYTVYLSILLYKKQLDYTQTKRVQIRVSLKFHSEIPSKFQK